MKCDIDFYWYKIGFSNTHKITQKLYLDKMEQNTSFIEWAVSRCHIKKIVRNDT